MTSSAHLSWKDVLDKKKFFLTAEQMAGAAISVGYQYFNFDSKIYEIVKGGKGYKETGKSEWDLLSNEL